MLGGFFHYINKTKEIIMAAAKPRSLDLGQLQNEVETASRTLKAANTVLSKAQESQERAEREYHASTKALMAGVAQLTAATKVL